MDQDWGKRRSSTLTTGASSKSFKSSAKHAPAPLPKPDLKPATPPKTNPWQRNKLVEPSSEADPGKPSAPSSDSKSPAENNSGSSPSPSPVALPEAQRSVSCPAVASPGSQPLTTAKRVEELISSPSKSSGGSSKNRKQKRHAARLAKRASTTPPLTPKNGEPSPSPGAAQPGLEIDSLPVFPPLDGAFSRTEPPSSTVWSASRKLFAQQSSPRPSSTKKPPRFPRNLSGSEPKERRGSKEELKPLESAQHSTPTSPNRTPSSSETEFLTPPNRSDEPGMGRSSNWEGPLPKLLTAQPFIPASSDGFRGRVEEKAEAVITQGRVLKPLPRYSRNGLGTQGTSQDGGMQQPNYPPAASEIQEPSAIISPSTSTPAPHTDMSDSTQPPSSSISWTEETGSSENGSMNKSGSMPQSLSVDVLGGASAIDEPLRSAFSDGSVPTAKKTPAHAARGLHQKAALTDCTSLWRHPFGADVHVHTGAMVYYVHRDIITAQSGWFREHLGPPNHDGKPVEIRMPHTDAAVVHCLRFMYTHQIEICEQSKHHALNMMHLPRCTLAYAAAVCLRIDKMVNHLVRIVENTAAHLVHSLKASALWRDCDWNNVFTVHLHHALAVTYQEHAQHLMEPMRMALAAVIDASFSHLMGSPGFVDLIQSSMWQQFGSAISADVVRYRQGTATTEPRRGRRASQGHPENNP